MYKKGWCTCKIVVLLINPIAFVAFQLPSPSSNFKVPNDYFNRSCTYRLVNSIRLQKSVKHSVRITIKTCTQSAREKNKQTTSPFSIQWVCSDQGGLKKMSMSFQKSVYNSTLFANLIHPPRIFLHKARVCLPSGTKLRNCAAMR